MFLLSKSWIETCWEAPAEGFVSLLDQQLDELKKETETQADTSAQPVLNKKKKKKKKKKEQEQFEEDEYYEEEDQDGARQEEDGVASIGQWQSVEKP